MKKPVHKGWIILVLAVINLLIFLGFGRFSLGAVLPFMKDGLKLNYREMGLIASSVFLGYLISATVVGHILSRVSIKRVLLSTIGITILGMIGSGLSTNFWMAWVSCLIVGIGAGGGNVTNLGLTGRWFASSHRGMALGIVNAGSGLGMLFSGFLVPYVIALDPAEGWRISWYVLSGMSVIFLIFNVLWMKNSPGDVGLQPIGRERELKTQLDEKLAGKMEDVYKNKKLWLIGWIYLTWGFSYLAFSTFFVDYLIQEVRMEEKTAGQFFAMAGMASIISGFIWGSLSDRWGRFAALFLIYVLESVVLLAISLSHYTGVLLVETILYAITLWGVPTVMVAAVGDLVPPGKIPVAIGFITVFFGVGQLVSPIVTGYLLDYTGSYLSVFIASSVICFLGSLGCLWFYVTEKRRNAYLYSQ